MAPVAQQYISNDLTILGDLKTSGSITLDGAIEGNIYCASLLIMPNGRVSGGVVALREVIVQGAVTGAIHSRHVTLQSSAKVEGNIFYQRIGIEMGASYEGALRRTEDEYIPDDFNASELDEQNSSEGASKSAKTGDNGNESQSPASRRMSERGRLDEMHDPQAKASSHGGEPNRRFSMHYDQQKRYREDSLRNETGACLPAE